MDLDALYDSACSVSAENSGKNVGKVRFLAFVQSIDNAMEDMVADILKTSRVHENVMDAARKGSRRAVVWAITSSRLYGSTAKIVTDGVEYMPKRFSAAYLVKGPKRSEQIPYGLQFFKANGISSLQDRLSAHFLPFTTHVNYTLNDTVEVVLGWASKGGLMVSKEDDDDDDVILV